jgi:hydrogenase/urease accessory protein HupE
LNCIEVERARNGRYSFSHPLGTHDDLAYALAMAVWAATQSSGKVIMMKY